MNVEHRKIFITGLQEWFNQLTIRKNDLEEEWRTAATKTERRFYLRKRIDRVLEMTTNIKEEIKQQKNASKHYIGI